MKYRTAVELIPLDQLKPWDRNPKRHPKVQIERLAGSLQTNGWTRPVIIDEQRRILAGHGIVQAARFLKLAAAPCIVADGLTETQCRAYVIADNRLTELGAWDNDTLRSELEALATDDVRLDDLGFDDAKLVLLGIGKQGADADAGAQVDEQETPHSQRGELYELGEHRLLCGDSTDPAQVARVVNGNRVGLINTDPPYGVDYSAVKNGIPRSGFRDISARVGDIENDTLTDGPALQSFLESAIKAVLPQVTEAPAFYLWHPMLTQGTFFAAAAAAAADILIHRQIVWVKPHLVLTRSGQYHWRHELCFYGWIRGKPCPWYGNKGQTSVWDDVIAPARETEHPTQKPVDLFARPIRNHLKPGEWCYEPFAGSGSQIIAAEQERVHCAAIEISPRWCDAIRRRWTAYAIANAIEPGPGRLDPLP
jgi:DNA modification methylase